MNLSDLIWKIIQDKFPVLIIEGKVVSVDKQQDTCTLKPEDDRPEIFDVRLCAIVDDITNKLVIYPKPESLALVCLIENNQTEAYLLAASEVEEFHLKADKIVFNGGQLKGLPKVESVKQRLNLIEDKINAIISWANTHVHAGNGQPPTAIFSGGNLNTTNLTDIENPDILQ
jgi:hypothetical protein